MPLRGNQWVLSLENSFYSVAQIRRRFRPELDAHRAANSAHAPDADLQEQHHQNLRRGSTALDLRPWATGLSGLRLGEDIA